MTIEESKKALFEVHSEYMRHTKEERIKLYSLYQSKRAEIKSELARSIQNKKDNI